MSMFGKNRLSFLMKNLALILKKKIIENTLMYTNNGYINTVNGGELPSYIHSFIIGQLIVDTNSPENLADYICQENVIKNQPSF